VNCNYSVTDSFLAYHNWQLANILASNGIPCLNAGAIITFNTLASVKRTCTVCVYLYIIVECSVLIQFYCNFHCKCCNLFWKGNFKAMLTSPLHLGVQSASSYSLEKLLLQTSDLHSVISLRPPRKCCFVMTLCFLPCSPLYIASLCCFKAIQPPSVHSRSYCLKSCSNRQAHRLSIANHCFIVLQ